jgi:manganese transport protein
MSEWFFFIFIMSLSLCAGGSQFGYTLLNVVFIASMIAVIVQVLALRLGVAIQFYFNFLFYLLFCYHCFFRSYATGAASGKDLAQLCRAHYPRWANLILFVLAEIAIVSTDLAEVIGSAIAINLLFGLPLWAGVLITAGDVVLVLWGLQRFQAVFEAMMALLVTAIVICFVYLLTQAPLNMSAIAFGYCPSAAEFSGPALFVGISIVGATVMPHSIFLHSALARDHAREQSVHVAIKWLTFDAVVMLTVAFFVNSAILIVIAA